MNQQQERIFELVKNHFSLDTKSLDVFRHRLIDPLIPDHFKDKVDSEFRIKLKLLPEERQNFDAGWSEFCDLFYQLKKDFKITYENFVSNKVVHNKNTYKLATLFKKHVESYCLSNLNTCLEKRLTDNAGQVIISFNFADWLLCSTGENWSSCMNLESEHEGSYWASIPGFAVDKNRCLVYITSGKKKEYLGITVDSIIARTWGLIDNNDFLNLIRFYPVHIDDGGIGKYLEKMIGIKVKHLETNFRSKYSFDVLRFESGDSCYGYIDNARLNKKDNKFRIVGGNGGFSFYNKDNKYVNSDLFCYDNGLKEMIRNKDKIGNHLPENQVFYCDDCGDSFDESEIIETDNGMYCEHCYNELYVNCEDCGRQIRNEDAINTFYNTAICSVCYEKEYFTCDKCGEVFCNEDLKKTKKSPGDSLCKKCYNKILQKAKSAV